MMSSVYAVSEKSPVELERGRAFVLAKGAPESIMKHCTHYLKGSEKELNGLTYLSKTPKLELSDKFVEYISNQSAHMASSGLRVLALALRNVTAEEGEQIMKAGDSKAAEKELTLVGLIGLIDPPKL
jgi:Ca2+-transporting ATPase